MVFFKNLAYKNSEHKNSQNMSFDRFTLAENSNALAYQNINWVSFKTEFFVGKKLNIFTKISICHFSIFQGISPIIFQDLFQRLVQLKMPERARKEDGAGGYGRESEKGR